MPRSMRASTRRAIVITSAAALVAVAIMPAVAAVTEPQGAAATALTMHQQATGDAQKLVVASEAQSVELDRDVYVASTPAEVAEARAAEAARVENARRAAEAEAARQAAATPPAAPRTRSHRRTRPVRVRCVIRCPPARTTSAARSGEATSAPT